MNRKILTKRVVWSMPVVSPRLRHAVSKLFIQVGLIQFPILFNLGRPVLIRKNTSATFLDVAGPNPWDTLSVTFPR